MQKCKGAYAAVCSVQRAHKAAHCLPGGSETNLIFTGSNDLYDFCFNIQNIEDNGISHISSVCSETD